MKLALEFPDPEPIVVAYLKDQFDLLGEDVAVGVDVPPGWTPTSRPHVQVSWDGTPIVLRGIVGFATIRLVARAANTSDTKALASRAQGILCAIQGVEITGADWLTGVLPARDPETNHEIAASTTRVTLRSALIEPSGS